jgi:YVTN family beta-propeller protein
MDIVNINDLLYVPTTMPDRGLLSKDQPLPTQVLANPVVVQGLDNQPHVAHPGAMFDSTRSYNFEDVRNGLMQLDYQLGASLSFVYYTDDVSSEPNFQAPQKVLSGALATAVVRSSDGSKIFLAHGGSDVVQELVVNTAARPFTVTEQQGLTFKTAHRPYALTLNEQANQLYVADWGSDVVEVIDLAAGKSIAQVDLGYAQPAYPATNVESGELFFYNAAWSNNGRKACATCHIDELDTDGVGFSNGATAPTEYHQVKPNHNLADTPAYFWNGSFGNSNYTSLAFGAQTKTNCELVEFGLIEGPGSDPNTRVGDPNNFTANAQLDTQCRPVDGNVPGEVANAAQIAKVVAQEQKVQDGIIQQVTGQNNRQALARLVDVYSVAENRLPPNPQRFLYEQKQLVQADIDTITQGQQVFQSAGCVNCHSNTTTNAYGQKIYTDQRNHGGGADWVQRFVGAYGNDPRVTNVIGSIPQTMVQAAIVQSTPDKEINTHVAPIDFFVPFCFDVTNCEEFDDPLAVFTNNNQQNPEFVEESRRLDLLVKVNLADPDRGFVPGNVFVAPQINTPSLRGMWTQANLLHHGLARSIREAVLAPGHPQLKPGETGFAIDRFGNTDVHGQTSTLGQAEINALVQYVQTIQ